MDIDTFRGVVTVVLMALFVALVFWAYGRGRRDEFAQIALLPLENDRTPGAAEESR